MTAEWEHEVAGLAGEPDGEFEAAAEAEEFLGGAPYTPSPIIQRICLNAGRLANRLRLQMRRARALSLPFHRSIAMGGIRRRGARWVNGISNRMLPILDRFHLNDLDRLNGCLTRVALAMGQETAPLRRLRRAIGQRLGMTP